MIQAESFYDKQLHCHAFLHRPGEHSRRADLKAVDDALRDIRFSEYKQKKISKIQAESLIEDFSIDQSLQEDIDKPSVKSPTERRLELHANRYSVRAWHAAANETKCALDEAGNNGKGSNVNIGEGESVGHRELVPEAVRNKISCAFNYKSSSELHEALKFRCCSPQTTNPDRNYTMHDNKKDYSSFDASVEDDQLKHLLEIKRWRSKIMKHVPGAAK